MPVRYSADAHCANSLVADGCVIEGSVENSILFRGVRVAKGARIRNSILMQGDTVESGVEIEHVILDKHVTVLSGSRLIAYTGSLISPSLTVPESVTEIGPKACAYTELASVTIPGHVSFIGDSAFSGCGNLSSVILPRSLTASKHTPLRAVPPCRPSSFPKASPGSANMPSTGAADWIRLSFPKP